MNNETVVNHRPKVYLIDVLSDMNCEVAAINCTSSKPISERFEKMGDTLITNTSPLNKRPALKKVMEYGHDAITEFNEFVFGIENVNRATEAQFIRHRVSSYGIKSGRYTTGSKPLNVAMPAHLFNDDKAVEILSLVNDYYLELIERGVKSEDARLFLPQGLATQMVVKMNARTLLNFFSVRCCSCAQAQIQDVANQMLAICKEYSPTIFDKAGAKCERIGYCTEDKNRWCHRKPHISEINTFTTTQIQYITSELIDGLTCGDDVDGKQYHLEQALKLIVPDEFKDCKADWKWPNGIEPD